MSAGTRERRGRGPERGARKCGSGPSLGLPEIAAGDPLGELIAARAGKLVDGDVIVVSQKVVSKAEGRLRRLVQRHPRRRSAQAGVVLGKEPNLVQLILEESAEVIRAERGVLIVETVHGLVCANAGIDSSNVGDPESVLLLPEDPDASARRLRAEIGGAAGARIGVVIADSFGRAWRIGQAEVAIGCAGLVPIDDWRGRHDANGRELKATQIAIADEAAVGRRPGPRQGRGGAGGGGRRPRPLGHRGGRPRRGGDPPAARGRPLPLAAALAGRRASHPSVFVKGVADLVDALLELARRLVGLALVLQVFVAGQVPGRLLDASFGLVGVARRVSHFDPFPSLSVCPGVPVPTRDS